MQNYENKSAPQNKAGRAKVKKPSQNRKKKKLIPHQQRPIICPPDKAGMELKLRVLGYITRAAVIATAVFALVFFMLDALKLEAQEIKIPTRLLALVSFVSVAVFSMMRLSKYGRVAGAVTILGAGVWIVLYTGNIISFAEKVFLTLKNVALTRLYNLGYYAVIKYMSEVSYTSSQTKELCFNFGVAVFTVLLSLIFTLPIIKKARLLLPAIISTLLLGVIFTYNISRSNWGVTLIIASFGDSGDGRQTDFTAKPDSRKVRHRSLLFERATEKACAPDNLPEFSRQSRQENRRAS